MIRGTAAWAIGQIQRYKNEALIECVADQLAKETDPETVEEMTKALETLRAKRLPRSMR